MALALFLNPLSPGRMKESKGSSKSSGTGGRRKVAKRRVYRKNPTWARVGAKKGRKSKTAWRRSYVKGMKKAGKMNPAWKRVGATKGRKSTVAWKRRQKAGVRKKKNPMNPTWAWIRKGRPKRKVKSRRAWRRRQAAGIRRTKRSSARRSSAPKRKVRSTMARRKKRKSTRRRARRVTTTTRRRRRARRKNPMPTRRRRRRSRRRNPVNPMPTRRRRRRSTRRRSTRRRRNPLSITSDFKGLIKKDAVNTYMYVGAGFVAGGILPSLIEKALAKLGVMPTGSTIMKMGVGLGAAAVAGIGTKMLTKSNEKAKLVAAGAVAGVVGAFVLQKIEEMMPGTVVSGLGAADDDVRRAIEMQVKRELGVSGMGEYIEPGDLNGVGEYVDPNVLMDAPVVAGMGLEASEDIPEVDTFGDGGF